ncbi:hypothetical protein Clacol_008660 [Clathrus columnatus]|uniref:F-box domain-containing protein n=1 Tax=Clathrus columnatus TaxID=1419009 RepID=A0AAV5AND1_9AGAM|nr:hypothetical protein Clacol_008660 [Clathrus columnatus]
MPYPKGLSLYTIWEEIANLLDSTKDLLSLALTCHTFKELIIPDHLYYRHLSIDIRMKSVWEFLERRPGLAKSVRSIKLSNLSTGRLPPALSGLTVKIPSHIPVSDSDIAIFKSAISNMPLLKEFSWGRFDKGSPEQLIDISHALTTSVPCLGLDVDLSDLTIVMCGQHQMKRLSVNLWTLTSLKRVVLRTQFPSPDAIQMILSCPNIEDLYFHATSSTMHIFPFHLMQQANWTKLRRLDLQLISPLNEQESDNDDTSTIITSFLNRHSNIECLSLCVSPKIALSTLPPSALPKLRSLSSDIDVVTSLFSQSAISRLVHLTCTIAQVDANALPQMDQLESLQLSGGNGNAPDLVHPFLSKSPNLKKICLALKIPSGSRTLNLNNTRPAIAETLAVDFLGKVRCTYVDILREKG